jgi:hypothetical protein
VGRTLLIAAAAVVLVSGSTTTTAAERALTLRASSVGPSLALVSSLDARSELVDAGSASDGSGQSARLGDQPGKVFLMSLIVPGAGQVARGERRGYLYLLAELAFWSSFYVLDNKGLDERDEYERYADENWNYSAYLDWYDENCSDCEDCAGDYECRPLAEYGTQEYYEDIGKYATYWRWWNLDGDEGDIAWDEYSLSDLGFRDDYWGMRDDSNTHLRQARYFMTAAFLNHLVSAADAFLSARRGGDEKSSSNDLGIEFGVPDSGEGLKCALVARY